MPVVSIFDCCCGTGGMLTIGKEWLQKNVNEKITVDEISVNGLKANI